MASVLTDDKGGMMMTAVCRVKTQNAGQVKHAVLKDLDCDFLPQKRHWTLHYFQTNTALNPKNLEHDDCRP